MLQYLQIWQKVQGTILTEIPEQLQWKWTTDGIYSAPSCYFASFQVSTSCFSWKIIWKSWAPPRVKFFHWLASQDRCWTAERLARHGLQHHPRCPLCDQSPEIIRHLLLEFPVTRQAWHEIMVWLRMTARPPDQEASIMEWWHRAKRETPKQLRKRTGLSGIADPLYDLEAQKRLCLRRRSALCPVVDQ